jgi:hypothetical protein
MLCRENLISVTGILHEDQYLFINISLSQFFLEWEMFQTKVVEKIKTYILILITFFENCVVYVVMRKTIAE